MKSKTLFSKYTKENFRRQLWALALMISVLLLFLPVQAFMRLDGWSSTTGVPLSQLRDDFISLLFTSSQIGLTIFSFVIPVLGGLMGVFDFSFLHSEKQVDFYYSFPVRKKELFLGKLLVSYIYFLIAYTIMLALTLLVGWNWNLLTQSSLIAALEVWLLNQVAYLLTYLTAAVAMILTGRLVVGVLGSAVLLGFGILLKTLYEGYVERFFHTFISEYGASQILYYLAPICYGPKSGQSLSNLLYAGQNTLWPFLLRLLAGIAVAVGLAFLGIFLMDKRSAEAAGKSMAFPRTARVIHIILSMAGGLWIGLFVQSIVYNRRSFWLIASTVCGVLLVYGIVQFIYSLDIRKTFAYRWQIFAVEAVTLGIACLFCFDLVGYDAYLPEKDKVESIAINLETQSMHENIYADGKYQDSMSYRLDHMRLTNVDEIYGMLEQVVVRQRIYDMNDSYGEGSNDTVMQVRYRTKGGREINRKYMLSLEKYRTVFTKLYDRPEFRKELFLLLGKMGDDTGRIMLNYGGEETTIFPKSGEKQKEFMDLYRGEMNSLPGSVFTEETPLAYLIVDYGEKKYAQTKMYLYPSCVNSLAYLKEMGWDIKPLFELDRIREIKIRDYRKRIASETSSAVGQLVYKDSDAELQEGVKLYTERSELEAIAPALLTAHCISGWQSYRRDIYAEVVFTGPKDYDIVIECYLDNKNFPEILEQ